MHAVLIQQRCVEALKGEVVFSATMSQADKTGMVDRVGSVIVLCLRYKVFERSHEGDNEINDVGKVRVMVYDQFVGW